MQDIVPPIKRKSIRDIPLPDGRVRIQNNIKDNIDMPAREIRETREREPREEHFDNNFVKNKKGGKSKWMYIGITVIAVILIIFFSRSHAKVFVESKEITQNANVSALIPFSPVEVSVEKNLSIKATGEEKVTQKAKGKITIFNEYEEADQRLLKDTRFESSNGLIFRIPSSVVVPGLKRDDKGNVVPGKLEVEVVADQAGDKYNISAGKFTVPGFKDLPQYNSFYAVSNSSMTGGFDGIRKVISETDREQAESALKTQLKDQLIQDAKAKSNEETIVIADESMIVYEILEDKVNGDQVLVSAKGTIKAPSFDVKVFGNSIASAVIPNFTANENVVINNLDKIKILLTPSETETNKMNVELSGSVDFVWKNNYELLKQSLAGTKKAEIQNVVDLYPGITRVTSIEVRPIWSGSFPEDISKIEIIDEAI